MKKLKRWIRKNKLLSIVLAVAGVVLAPFLWPFILAIAFQSLSLALPVLAVYFIVRQPKGIKDADGRYGASEQWGGVQPDIYAAEQHHGPVSYNAVQETGSLLPEGREKRPEPVENGSQDEDTGRRCPAKPQRISVWYQREGRGKILHLKKKASQEGSHSFSVDRDGFCSIRRNKKSHRIGVIKNLPRECIQDLAKEIEADGMKLRISGKYVRFSWGEEAYD